MAGGLGGLGGFDFGGVLGALGQSLLMSPRENPFQGLPQTLQAVTQQREHLASLNALAQVAEKLGIPKEIAANPDAMKLFIQHLNTQKQNALTQQYLGQGSSLTPPGGDTAAPAMSVPPVPGGAGGLGGLGVGATAPVPPVRPPSFTQAGGRGGASMTLPVDPALAPAIAKHATAAGLDPVDVATAMSYETGGTFDPWKAGPTTKWGQHRGLIQWGQPQARQYGVTKETPVEDQVAAAVQYLKDRGVKPGMGLMDIYSAINAGSVGRNNASDAAAGGAPGTVADKVNNQMGAHRAKAQALLATVQPDPGQRPYQVASSAKTIPVPINPPAMPAQTTPAATGATGNTTRAWAQQNFNMALKRIAVAEQAGLHGIVEAEKAKLPIYTKYLTPSEAAIRVQEAGLEGTPQGRAIIADLPAGVQEKLSEQLVPGYKAPGTLEQEKFDVAKDQQAWQRVETETARRERTDLATKRFGLDSRRYLSDLEKQQADQEYRERHFGLEKERYLSDQEKELAARDFRERQLAERTRLAEMTPAEREGRAARRAPEDVAVGKAAKVAEIGAETTARNTATALTREAEAATNAGRMASRLLPALKQARTAFNELKDAGTGQFGGIGPSANSPASRAIAARMPEWSPAFKNEVNRQKFDSAMAAIRSAKTAVDLKGQGPVSNFERTLAGADLPDPASVSAKVVEEAFARLESQLNAALELDRKLGFHAGEQPAAKADDWLDIGGGVRVRRK